MVVTHSTLYIDAVTTHHLSKGCDGHSITLYIEVVATLPLLKEMVWQIMKSAVSAKEMQAFMQTASETERLMIEQELKRVTGIDNNKAAAAAEFE